MIDQYMRNLQSDLGKVKAETASVIAEESRAKRALDECNANITKMQTYALSVDKFKKAGCEVIELSDADRQQWQDQAKAAGVNDLVKSKMEHPEYLDQVLNKQY